MLLEGKIYTDGLSEALEKGIATDVFVKDQLLYKQREWRLCVYRDVQEENRYFLPPLGSLEDIAQLVEIENLNIVLKKQHQGLSYSLIHPDPNINYEGNISRDALQKKISADGRYRVLFNLV